mgnify:CR=1 FL=1
MFNIFGFLDNSYIEILVIVLIVLLLIRFVQKMWSLVALVMAALELVIVRVLSICKIEELVCW